MNGLPDVEDENSFVNEDGYQDNDDDQLSPGDGGFKVKKGEQRRVICTPYIQVFKNGNRIYQSIKHK